MKNNYEKVTRIKNKLIGVFREIGLSILFLAFSINAIAQSTPKVNLNVKNVEISKAFDALQKQVKLHIFYNHEHLNALAKVSLTVVDQPLDKVLGQLLDNTGLTFVFRDNTVVIGPKDEKAGNANSKTKLISGEITDDRKQPLPGVTVKDLSSGKGTNTDERGQFKLNVADNAVLMISSIGMEPQRIAVAGKTFLKVVMEESNNTINEVVVTGIPFTRKAESFTGSFTTFTAKELQRVGSQNIFQSLKNLEPSLNLITDFANGSDPNRLPDMQIRGSSSFPDLKGEYATRPNQPLFIVDGFEMTIDKISDLPLVRIASVTILKDASAKALYGSRAANGVIVIEMVKAKPGELRINYTGTFGIENPDLSSYNLSNAFEKLSLEKQLGAYDRLQPIVGLIADSLYYNNLKEVQSGVNTDWLAQPVQVGRTSKHALSLDAGDERLMVALSFFTNNTQGVMKGSERNNYGGSFSLTYRYKNVLFRNQFQLNNVKAINSPYGSFSDYAKLNPYWRPYNEDGSVRKFLGIGPVSSEMVYNPMYNATFNSKNTTEYTNFTNNTHIEWAATKDIKVIGRVGVSSTVNGSELFYPGGNTKFISLTGDNAFLKGTYDKGNGKASMVSGDLNINYSKVWGLHSLFTNIGAILREDNSENYLYSAIGFPNDRMNNIIFAKQYALNSKPFGSESLSRELGTLAAVNYSYDGRYAADLSIRYGTSSQFGTNSRWGAFWSAGAAWNIYKEKFFDVEWINLLKLRGSLGNTGSQNFNSYQAMLLYNYFVDNSYQGMLGAYLNGLANNDLKWQQRMDYNIGIESELMNHLSLRFEVYKGITNNLLTDITTPPSLGFGTYKANLGQLVNQGFEFRVNYKMFANSGNRQSLNLFATGASNTNKIVKISNSLQSLTNEQDQLSKTSNKPLVRFEEGQSLDAIWAVRSNGIDPATGKEIFVKKNGTLTDIWDANDKVVVGINQPKITGTLGANFDYKGFSVGVVGLYRMGGQVYNQTLVDKVENALLNFNVDKRAYYDSWKKPGDNALYKNIGVRNAATLATSRFVQDLSEFSISSVSVGYDFYRYAFVKKLKLQSLQVMLNLNDVYQFSTVRIERGTTYPFARYGTLTLNANF
ncbi:MAG: SusC/RagA family TonB-linked outer membrane protein [Candidatus Pedobacter colombiensis]|uniref:SusC/RagA family TonB-linked outer membrane protein n=1 Tax=Candidatus Pedobacter colombiensis TaxID=3121371 RepID=A0AAJ6B6I9_9SPHI|nr:SusC/RagA family TonB-linked outer membrane protein [Pedobacter sp.]WEK18481.1 MAG: SusC/RagA family TonB-linked outer membrane protein [Pedobacter sp.]